MSSFHIALVVAGHLDVTMLGRDRIRERPLCRGQIDCKNAKGAQAHDRKGRRPFGRGDRQCS